MLKSFPAFVILEILAAYNIDRFYLIYLLDFKVVKES